MDCRSFRETFPPRGRVVMVVVDRVSVKRDRASVSLVDYGNIRATLRFRPDQRADVQRGRMEPAMVRRVRLLPLRSSRLQSRLRHGLHRLRFRSITVDLDGFNQQQRSLCERVHTQSLYVKSVLRHCLMAHEDDDDLSSLLQISKLARWPRFEHLTDVDSAYWDTLPEAFRLRLRASSIAVVYDSWRVTNNRILSSPRLVQIGPYCSIIAVVRHYEAGLKRLGWLALEDSLSIQHLINNIPERLINEEGIRDLRDVLDTLGDVGAISSRDGPPLTFQRGPALPPVNRVRIYRPVSVLIENFRNDDAGLKLLWSELIKSRLRNGPLAASIIWFPSYPRVVQANQVLSPTAEEFRSYKQNPQNPDLVVHTMLLTGHGVDENGISYFEYQDSSGNVSNGDGGYLRVAQEVDQEPLVIEYVTIEYR